jgi:hypothetical protein
LHTPAMEISAPAKKSRRFIMTSARRHRNWQTIRASSISVASPLPKFR